MREAIAANATAAQQNLRTQIAQPTPGQHPPLRRASHSIGKDLLTVRGLRHQGQRQ
jgi:hypothetical protein